MDRECGEKDEVDAGIAWKERDVGLHKVTAVCVVTEVVGCGGMDIV